MNDNYNLFFYANSCHVCKRFGDGVRLKRCGGCGMIAYCGRQHQKQHWPGHKHLCKIIQDMFRGSRMRTRDVPLQEWAQLKMNLMLLVAVKLSRHLEEYEKQMFKFPRACLVCHERNNLLLVDCQNCASVSFCERHKDSPAHIEHACDLLKLCFTLDETSSANINGDSPNLDYLQCNVSNDRTFRDMKDFINTHANIVEGQSGVPSNVSIAVHSEYLTRPLTLFYGLQILDHIPRCDSLIVHIVGANFLEVETARAWELLLHLISSVRSVKIMMIGPELPHGTATIVTSICDNCVAQKKELSFEIHNMLYETYIYGTSFVMPDVVVGFNTGIHECKEVAYPEETWVPSIRALAENNNCPLILSCYTRMEAEKEMARINVILKNEIKCVHSGKNPFASLRPYRDYETEDLFYQNNYVIIYRNLHP